jgi:hypothetical protein
VAARGKMRIRELATRTLVIWLFGFPNLRFDGFELTEITESLCPRDEKKITKRLIHCDERPAPHVTHHENFFYIFSNSEGSWWLCRTWWLSVQSAKIDCNTAVPVSDPASQF